MLICCGFVWFWGVLLGLTRPLLGPYWPLYAPMGPYWPLLLGALFGPIRPLLAPIGALLAPYWRNIEYFASACRSVGRGAPIDRSFPRACKTIMLCTAVRDRIWGVMHLRPSGPDCGRTATGKASKSALRQGEGRPGSSSPAKIWPGCPSSGPGHYRVT